MCVRQHLYSVSMSLLSQVKEKYQMPGKTFFEKKKKSESCLKMLIFFAVNMRGLAVASAAENPFSFFALPPKPTQRGSQNSCNGVKLSKLHHAKKKGASAACQGREGTLPCSLCVCVCVLLMQPCMTNTSQAAAAAAAVSQAPSFTLFISGLSPVTPTHQRILLWGSTQPPQA